MRPACSFGFKPAVLLLLLALAGTVKTQAELDHALAVARKVKGVKDVRSELKVGS